MKEIILASASPRRSELLKQVGIKFEVIPSNIKETIDESLKPEEYAKILSYEKALSVAKGLKSPSVVLGADTIVVKNGMIMGKPQDEEEAFGMLKSLQGDWHEVITGITLIESSGFESIREFEKTRVKMRLLSEKDIKAYIKTGEPMDKAGAYGIQGVGALLVEKIEGCYFNVVGLPLNRLGLMLEKFGVFILN
jgi:septum formation protein